MSNVSNIYTLWLKPWHLPAGQPISVTIEKAETRTIHPRPTEERIALVLSFVGKNRKLILNDGNANKMSDIGGEDWAAWRGLVIELKRVQFTKDKETIHILPSAAPNVDKPVVPRVESNAADPAPQPPQANGGNGNGHTEKTYRFPNDASRVFFNTVQGSTDNFYRDAPHLLEVIGGWFNFGSKDLWDEKLSTAVDHARNKRQAEQPVEVEDQSES